MHDRSSSTPAAKGLVLVAFAFLFLVLSVLPTTAGASEAASPTTVAAACRQDARRAAACDLVQAFFRALDTRRFTAACTLLGSRLRDQNRGLGCPHFLAVGYPEPMPWGILTVASTTHGVSVLVTLGQSELDRVRMRRHRARVALENGRLRIVETRLVR